ncbi:MAG: monooxygenase [Acidobacteria bacterium SCN 69-37]|nr:MAG: monooxygenase [Acidobacteria bacterium SCN 69-37]
MAEIYDVIVVGSGAAGGMAAHALTARGARVLVLEAGAPNTDRTFEQKATYDLPFQGFGDPTKVPHVFQASEANENQWVSERQVPYSYPAGVPYNWVRVRMTGGRTNYWARMSFRLSDLEFKGKDFDGFGENWPLDHAELAPFYERAETIFQVAGKSEGLSQLPDGKFVERDTNYGPVAQRLVDIAKARGIPNTLTRSALGRGGQASSANLLLPDALKTGRLTLVPNAVAREISVDRQTGRVNGVHFVDRLSGRERHARGRFVVVGAGCLESTRLLLNSNIANSSDALGRYLHDQFYITNTIWAINPDVRDGKIARNTAGGNGYMPRFRNLQKNEKHDFIRGYALQWSLGGSPGLDYFPGYGESQRAAMERHQGAGFTATAMGDVLPRADNRVTINRDVVDDFGIPTLHIACRYTDNEFNMAADAVRVLEELSHEMGFEVLTRRPEMYPPGYSIHEVGTCRMGDDPKTSVLNRWNQSHDIPNLLVVDGSSFVSAGYQNPTMTILALSLRASEHLADLVDKRDL